MATTLYFRNTTAAEPKPNAKQAGTTITQWLTSTLGGGQDGSSTTYPCDMSVTPGASNVTIGTSLTETGAAHYAWVKQFVSPALTAQTISGTFSLSCDFNEGNGLHNMNPHILIYVWKADDSGSRGTLYAAATSTLEADTTNGSLQTFTFASYTLSSLAVSAGDRIVVELMAYDNNTKTSAYDHIIGLNGATSSGYESSITFSMNLAWNLAACEAYAAEAILDYVAPTEAYAAEAILDYLIPPTEVYAAEAILNYVAPTEIYAVEAILDYLINPCEAYAAEAILDYVPGAVATEVYAAEGILDYVAPTEVYATEAILSYEVPPCEVYAAETILSYVAPTEVYAAEIILNYEINPCEVYAVEAILNYTAPTEAYATEAILNYEVPPCEVYAAEAILDYTVALASCEAYAAEAILDYNIFAACEAYAAEAILDYEINPSEVYAVEVILDYIATVAAEEEVSGGWWYR